MQMRDFLINKIFLEAKKNPNIIFISNEQGAKSLDIFRKKLPKQFINAGISEQNIISCAAGLAKKGKKVFIYSISSFITLRCFEQIKIDLNVMKLPVVILGVGASYSYDVAGPTHHSIDDIAILRTLQNFEIYSPSDNLSLNYFFKELLSRKMPCYVRLDRQELNNLERKVSSQKHGYSLITPKGKNLIISTGIGTHLAKKSNDLFDKNNKLMHIDIYKLKEFNKNKILKIIGNKQKIFTIEEHLLEGGLGSIILELVSDNNISTNIYRLGIKNTGVYTYLSREKIHRLHKIDEKSIYKYIKNK